MQRKQLSVCCVLGVQYATLCGVEIVHPWRSYKSFWVCSFMWSVDAHCTCTCIQCAICSLQPYDANIAVTTTTTTTTKPICVVCRFFFMFFRCKLTNAAKQKKYSQALSNALGRCGGNVLVRMNVCRKNTTVTTTNSKHLCNVGLFIDCLLHCIAMRRDARHCNKFAQCEALLFVVYWRKHLFSSPRWCRAFDLVRSHFEQFSIRMGIYNGACVALKRKAFVEKENDIGFYLVFNGEKNHAIQCNGFMFIKAIMLFVCTHMSTSVLHKFTLFKQSIHHQRATTVRKRLNSMYSGKYLLYICS